MSEELVLNPGSVSHQSAQLAPNHIHQSQWLTANPEHQTADPELTQTAELDKVVADNPLERLSKLNLGQWTLSSFTGLKVITNPDQTQSSEFQFSKQDQGLQSQLELVAEVLETAYQQEQATDDYQDDSPSLRFEERAWSRALDCCLENAKQAKQDGNSQTVNDSLMSGLILGHVNPNYSSHDAGRPFRRQVVSSGLAAELLTTVKDNNNLVLEEDRDEGFPHITTLVSTLETDKDMLELVVGRQLEMDQFNLKLAQQLSQAEVEEHIQSMNQQALVAASLSPEIGQRDPELQKQVIKATVGYLADANNYIIIGEAPIAELAKLRPDIFEDELQPELRKIRAKRMVGDSKRQYAQSVSVLDTAVLETWAAGNQDLASQMLTASQAEVTSDRQADPDNPCYERGELGRAVEYSQLKHDPDRAQTVLDEISQHINQRRTVMFDKVDHYINNFAEDNQLDQEVVEQSLDNLNRLLDKSRIDDSTDPEYYVQLLTDLAPKLVNKPNARPLQLLDDRDDTWVIAMAEMLLQNDRLIDVLGDKDTGPIMQSLFCPGLQAKFEALANTATDQRFQQIVSSCQLNSQDQVDWLRWTSTSQCLEDLSKFDVEEVVSRFSGDNAQLAERISQLPESLRSDLFFRLTTEDDNIRFDQLANLLKSDATLELLAKNQQVRLLDEIDGLLGWQPEQIDKHAQDLLQVLELPGIPELLADPVRANLLKTKLMESDGSYLEAGSRLTDILTDGGVAELLKHPLLVEHPLLADFEVIFNWGGPQATTDKSRQLLQALKLVDVPALMDNPSVRGYIINHIFNCSNQDYLKSATSLVDILTDDNMVEMFELFSQPWLAGSDIINSWPPEAVTSNARDLFQAFKLVEGLMVDPSLGGRIKNTILGAPHQNYLEVAKNLYHTLGQPRELWKNLYLVSTDLMGIDPGNDQANTHPISVLPKIELDMSSLPPNYHFIDAVKGFKPVNVSDLSVNNLRAILADSENLSDQQLQQFQTSVPFNCLTAEAKRQVYTYQLYETVQRTRSDSYKAAAEERNRQHQADESSPLEAGDFIHSTPLRALGGILQSGNLAGESRQLASRREDAFPFSVDLSVVKQVEPTPQQTIDQTLDQTCSGGYGDMSLIYDHNQSDWLRGKVVAVDRSTEGRLHSLALGGIPATEISAIVLKAPTELELQQTSRLIAENGFYIPIYSDDGQLKLSPEAYDNLRASYNIDQPIDTVIDNYLDADSQLGSNDGSEYYLPTDQGLKRYYIKFGGDLGRYNQDVNGVDHVWTEFLADELYREYGLAVPDTKMVQIDGRVGKASKWLDANQSPTAELTGLEDGFVMDALTSNLDAVYNSANIVEINGASYRIDNGDALDIYARGGRKQAKDWNQTVAELETRAWRPALANGMRHMYPGLTTQAFSAQVDRLADKFPDDKIDQLVDSIRRSAADRDSLKQTLKARRDYIISNQDRIASELSRPALQPVDRTPPEGLGVPTVIESLAA